jgi:hypothetical protein
MGLLDGLFGMFGSMGATVTQNVTQQQPTTPSGATYTAGGTSVTSQPATPINVTPQSPFSDPVGWLGGAAGYVGGGIQYAGQQIQNIAAPVAPVAPAIMVAPFIAAPIALGSMAIGGVQGFFAPKPQTMVSPSLGNGAAYSPIIMSAPVAPTTFFVSAGDKGQIPVVGKMMYEPSGSYEIFDMPYGHSITNIASSGSAGALQSGTVTLGPATPVIYNRESGMGTINTQYGNVELAAAVLANPDAYSDVGAEAYGGVVMPLDNRTLESSGAVIGKYPVSSGNLGNLVDPYILNQPKQNWAMDLPWQMSDYTNAPVIQSVDMQGRMVGISPLGAGSIGMITAPVSIPIRAGSPMVGLSVPPTKMNWLEQANYDVGGFLGIRAAGLEQNAKGQPLTPPLMKGTLRPSDFDLWAMQNTGFAAPALVGLSDFIVGGRTMITESSTSIPGSSITEIGKPWTTVKELSPGVFETTTFTPSMTTKTGGNLNTIILTPLPRGFDVGEEAFTKEVMGGLPAMNPAKPTGNVVLDYVAGFGRGAYEGVRTKPLTSAINFGVGMILVAGGEAVVGLGASTMVATEGSSILYPIAVGTNFFATRAAPVILTGLYTADVAQRSTQLNIPGWNLSKTNVDLSPKAAERFGGIFATETGPMILGGLTFAGRDTIANAFRRTPPELPTGPTGRPSGYNRRPIEGGGGLSDGRVFIENGVPEPQSAIRSPINVERYTPTKTMKQIEIENAARSFGKPAERYASYETKISENLDIAKYEQGTVNDPLIIESRRLSTSQPSSEGFWKEYINSDAYKTREPMRIDFETFGSKAGDIHAGTLRIQAQKYIQPKPGSPLDGSFLAMENNSLWGGDIRAKIQYDTPGCF